MKIVKTPQFNVDQLQIEDHVFESNDQQVKFVEKFIEKLDAAVQWVWIVSLPAMNNRGFRFSI